MILVVYNTDYLKVLIVNIGGISGLDFTFARNISIILIFSRMMIKFRSNSFNNDNYVYMISTKKKHHCQQLNLTNPSSYQEVLVDLCLSLIHASFNKNNLALITCVLRVDLWIESLFEEKGLTMLRRLTLSVIFFFSFHLIVKSFPSKLSKKHVFCSSSVCQLNKRHAQYKGHILYSVIRIDTPFRDIFFIPKAR
jgi:hypothetical protein